MAGIIDIEYALPSKVLTNEELEQCFPFWTAEKIYKKTGIRLRHVAEKETALDLAVEAAEKLLGKSTIDKKDVDCVIYVTQSPEYIMPSSACLLQERLGLDKHIHAFDINLGCSGYIYGLSIAKAFIESCMFANILLVTADTYSKYIHPQDRSTRTIFGDAATATLVGKRGWSLGECEFGTDGSGSDLFVIRAGGMKMPKTEVMEEEYLRDDSVCLDNHIYMDGPGIFDFTIREIPDNVARLLEKANLQKGDIDLFVFHQANAFMLDFLRRTLRIDLDKFYMNFSDIGNTVSSSVPIALKRAMQDSIMDKVNTVVISGFGVGLSWGTMILRKEE